MYPNVVISLAMEVPIDLSTYVMAGSVWGWPLFHLVVVEMGCLD